MGVRPAYPAYLAKELKALYLTQTSRAWYTGSVRNSRGFPGLQPEEGSGGEGLGAHWVEGGRGVRY